MKPDDLDALVRYLQEVREEEAAAAITTLRSELQTVTASWHHANKVLAAAERERDEFQRLLGRAQAERDDAIKENEALHDVHDLLLAARAECEALRALLGRARWWSSPIAPNEVLHAIDMALKESK